jgi:predicted transcriptional regulator
MSAAKERMTEVIQNQPDDATFEEMLRELAFEKMIEQGLSDSRQGKSLSNEEMKRRISAWQKQDGQKKLLNGFKTSAEERGFE